MPPLPFREWLTSQWKNLRCMNELKGCLGTSHSLIKLRSSGKRFKAQKTMIQKLRMIRCRDHLISKYSTKVQLFLKKKGVSLSYALLSM